MDSPLVESEGGGVAPELESEFNFDDWVKEVGLTRKTIGLLRSEDLNTKLALTLLSSEDLSMFPVTLGQRKLLWRGLGLLQSTAEISAAQIMATVSAEAPTLAGQNESTDNEGLAGNSLTIQDIRKQASELDAAGKSLDELLNPTRALPVKSVPVSNTGFDPRSILTLKAGVKTVHITQFLSEKTRKRRISRRREVVVPSLDQNGDKIVIQREDAQPYSGIFQSEWGAANCRLMHHLLTTGLLARQDIEFYLAYTAKIHDLADKYEWESILEYDFLYRERQAEHVFPWGSLAPDMELHVLTPKR
jgi:hypothetical protein